MERHANLGYLAVKRQATKLAVADTPDIYLPIYGADIRTNANLQTQNPIIGNKFARRSTLRGLRGHTGSITVEGEPNTVSIIMDMLLTRGSESGSDPYTNPFTLSKTTDPKYYTADISFVTHVVRYIGLAVSSVTPEWENNELRLNCGVSALKTIDALEVASDSEDTGVYTIVFKTEKDPSPTSGLVVGDTMQLYDVSAGTYIDFVIDSIPDGTSVTCSEDISAADPGDIVTIKPASAPTYSVLPTFTWGNTEFRFGATAAAALTATHTPLEQDSNFELQHPFEEDEGSKRSGSFDPASLPRMQGNFTFNIRKFFDTPEDMQRFISLDKHACVVRMFSYDGADTHEFRITLNNLTYDNPMPNPASEEILYSEIDLMGNYDTSDTHGMQVTTIGGISLA